MTLQAAPLNRTGMQRRHVLTASFTLLLGACATPLRPPQAGAPSSYWSGRLSLQIDQDPPQAFFSRFQLTGSAQQGTLELFDPLGSTVALIRWQPGLSELLQGRQVRRHASLQALVTELTGTDVPIVNLFDWLQGRPAEVPGWQPDLSQYRRGRISARRQQPLPAASLQVILDDPQTP